MNNKLEQYTGYPDSFSGTITTANGNTPITIGDLPAQYEFAPNQLIIDYDQSATARTTLEVFDEPDSTGAGNVSDSRLVARDVAPDDRLSYDNLLMRHFQEDFLVQADNNQDGTISIYVDGIVITGVNPNP